MSRSGFWFLPLMSALFLIFQSCTREFRFCEGMAWGTTYHITYRHDKPLDDSIEAVTRLVDASLSVFNANSTVRAINENRTTAVDSLFRRVFDCAVYVNALSGGMFDPTIAPMADLWGFGPSGDRLPPDSAAISEALRSVGIGSCHIDSSGHIVKRTASTSFDFSALAKGFGVDCIANMLERNGVDDYMVEVGGEVCVQGNSPRHTRWRIQIDAPRSDVPHSRLAVVELGPERSALASSGNYRNYRTDSAGVSYGHTISPITGHPVQTATLAATVSFSDCMTADALATAAMCLSPDSALSMLHHAGAKGLLATAVSDSLVLMSTPEFP